MKKNSYHSGRSNFALRINLMMFMLVAVELIVIFTVSTRLLLSKNSEVISNIMIASDEKVLKNSVDNIIRNIENTKELLKKEGKSDSEIKNVIRKRLYAKIHLNEYENGRYIWVNEIIDYNGGDGYAIRLMHPNLPDTEGEKLSTNTTDEQGNKPYQEELDLVNRSGSGFYRYFFKELHSDKVTEKMTYCRLYREYNWVICEGENLSGIREYETIQRRHLLPYVFRANLIMMIAALIVTMITAGLFSRKYNSILVEKNRELGMLVYRDHLTGLYNRGGLIAHLDDYCSSYDRNEMTGVFIDLDDFKLINDLYGHVAGDAALRDLAEYLVFAFPGCLIGRTGGDEFCVIIRNKSPEDCAKIILDALTEDRKFEFDGKMIRYTISGGYADFPSQASDRETLMKQMDSALYAAKTAGKHTVMHFKSDMMNISRDHMGFNVRSMVTGLPGAVLIYQAEGDERILFANDDLVRLFECKNHREFLEYTHSSFRHIVHPDDYIKVEQSIRDQILHEKNSSDTLKSTFDDYVEYRILTKNGNVRNVIDIGRMVHDEHFGDIFYVFIQDKEKLKKHE